MSSGTGDKFSPRRRTGILIVVADFFVVATVVGCEWPIFLHVGPWTFPVFVVTTGIAIQLIRMVLLLFMTGTVRELRHFLDLAMQGEDDKASASAARQATPPSTGWINSLAGYLDDHTGVWYSLLGLGFLAQALIVAGSGGMNRSPFTGILVATFVLGQFRAGNHRAIWALFLTGFGVSIATSALYLALINVDQTRYNLATDFAWPLRPIPLFLVAGMSTYVAASQKRDDQPWWAPLRRFWIRLRIRKWWKRRGA
ncbi:hypothetical protein [Nocardia sp. NPDC127526]|uniref:hypothetical protein n=1 Tax=Nocardia sp. NPDC127526 TaxID=3345393 RepID=UPI0036389B5D